LVTPAALAAAFAAMMSPCCCTATGRPASLGLRRVSTCVTNACCSCRDVHTDRHGTQTAPEQRKRLRRMLALHPVALCAPYPSGRRSLRPSALHAAQPQRLHSAVVALCARRLRPASQLSFASCTNFPCLGSASASGVGRWHLGGCVDGWRTAAGTRKAAIQRAKLAQVHI
jgi:hypothetical protein